jgi:predicted 3-demethylubiquinone-9 3-methyltransferase (glyoxalase superfamily)
MPTITPFLWYDDNAEEAVDFYSTLFDDVKVHDATRYGEAGPGTPGSVMTIEFEVAGQRLIALNGGPGYPMTEAFSLSVRVDSQDEVDRLYDGLAADGGLAHNCGWVRDRFGLWWQIVPATLEEVLSDPDPVKAQRAMKAMLGMHKLDIAALRAARDGAG